MTGIPHREADAMATAAVAVAKALATSGGEDAPIADLATLCRWSFGYGPRYAETLEALPFAFTPKMAEWVLLSSSWEAHWNARQRREKEVAKARPLGVDGQERNP